MFLPIFFSMNTSHIAIKTISVSSKSEIPKTSWQKLEDSLIYDCTLKPKYFAVLNFCRNIFGRFLQISADSYFGQFLQCNCENSKIVKIWLKAVFIE